MHIRGARRTGAPRQARGAHGRSAGARGRTRWGRLARVVCADGCLASGRVRIQAYGARACARAGVWRSGVRAGRRLARGHAGVQRRVRRRVYCSPQSTSFTRNHLNDLK
ncbi:hypothetical protein CRG98_017852 [Punica granatum]|nr:hypothetical protein CRG98_017852 [Punica granatum]